MAEVLQELTPKTFEAFMERLRADGSLSLEVIRGLDENGFVAVLRQFFQLSDSQTAQLEPLEARGAGAARWEQLITMAIVSGGNITIVHEGRRSFDLELHADFPILGHVDLSIHC